jgi:prepilin-type N-terminal cleavage/methylation domain-containing protein
MDDFRKDKGFTLVEILMAVFIGLILLGAVYITLNSGQRSSASVERKVAAQQDVRAALEVMAMEISMASFNPNFVSSTTLWTNPSTCTGPAPNSGWKGIQEATPTSLTIEMDLNQNGIIGDSNEIIRYYYDGLQTISRNVNCVGNQVFLGVDPSLQAGTNSARVINPTLQIYNGHGIPAIFRYYNGQSPAVELYPDTNPPDVANIRRIDIALGVQTDAVDPNTHQFKQMIYSTSVLVRNYVLQ